MATFGGGRYTCLPNISEGLKLDCTPTRLTMLATLSVIPGLGFGQCSELCGSLHAFMPVTIAVA